MFLGDGALEENRPNFLDGRAGLGSSGGRRDLESLELWEEKTSLGGWPQALVCPTGDMTYTGPCQHALPGPIPLKPLCEVAHGRQPVGPGIDVPGVQAHPLMTPGGLNNVSIFRMCHVVSETGWSLQRPSWSHLISPEASL